jgi:hypothetical protein
VFDRVPSRAKAIAGIDEDSNARPRSFVVHAARATTAKGKRGHAEDGFQ